MRLRRAALAEMTNTDLDRAMDGQFRVQFADPRLAQKFSNYNCRLCDRLGRGDFVSIVITRPFSVSCDRTPMRTCILPEMLVQRPVVNTRRLPCLRCFGRSTFCLDLSYSVTFVLGSVHGTLSPQQANCAMRATSTANAIGSANMKVMLQVVSIDNMCLSSDLEAHLDRCNVARENRRNVCCLGVVRCLD
jgi:hypothetical protein